MKLLKLPSIHKLWQNFRHLLARFPLPVLLAFVAPALWCWLLSLPTNNNMLEERLIRLLLACDLALTLLLAADLFAEVKGYQASKKWGLRLLALLICLGLHDLLQPSFYEADVYRFAFLIVAFHLLVAFIPFVGKGQLNGFWQYNKTLFLRFLTAALYTIVLFAGLALALLAIDGLFNTDINGKTYAYLFAILTSGFSVIFFLAGVPKDLTTLDKETNYPKGLKIFTQYVLIPLLTIYLSILLVYEANIIINWQLPKGLVSTLILGYAVFGILSLLLIYPIREEQENSWIKLFSRFFYVMMLPLVILLLLAVWERISHYGITEPRYILIILALWLALITIYFLLNKRQNIKIIPISLCILALLATYGPQSASNMAEYSQVLRLKKLIASKADKEMEEKAKIVDYLVKQHGLHALQAFTSVNLNALEQEIENKLDSSHQSRYSIRSEKVDTAYTLLGISPDAGMVVKYINLVPKGDEAINIKGYDYLLELDRYDTKITGRVQGVPVIIDRPQNSHNLKVTIGKDSVWFDIEKLINHAAKIYQTLPKKDTVTTYNRYYIPAEMLRLNASLKSYDLTFAATSLTVYIGQDTTKKNENWSSYKAYLLVKIKDNNH